MSNIGKSIGRTFVTALCAILLLALIPAGFSPHAATLDEKQAQADQLQKQLAALKQQGEQVAQQYSQKLSELESIRFLVAENQEKLDKAQTDYEESRKILASRLKAIYIAGEVNSVEVLLESTSIDDMLSRYDFLTCIANQDVDIFSEMKRLRTEVAERQRELKDQEVRQQQAAAQLQQAQMELRASLDAQEALLAGVNAEIISLMSSSSSSGSSGNSGSSSGSANIGSFVFPVRGSHTFSNDWHEPRTGHLHQGCDVFASMGTPCVACVAGTASTGEGKNAGNYIRLVGDDGNVYYYMHLQRFGQTGRVTAGTVIGYVGDTGNASGGPPHLHFEIHPDGGAAINPYPILKQYDR